MRNPLQEQLLKAGLVNKAKAAQVVREQARKHKGKTPAVAGAEQIDAQRLQVEKAERDRAIAAEHNAQVRRNEARAQVYRFTDGEKIRDVLVNEALRAQLAAGALVIVHHGDSYELLPRVAADKVRERDATMVVLDHGHPENGGNNDADDDYYKQFEVPDDLIW
jgi:uncharacterized protein YaiL (DUF2058 family)